MLGDQEVVPVIEYVREYFWRRRMRSYDVATPDLLSPLDCWRNSTPFFGMYALCTMKIVILGDPV